MAIHVGDIGARLGATILNEDGTAMDISTATTTDLLLQPQGAATRTRGASFVTDGTDGQVEYTTQGGDLDVAGTWSMQVHVVLSNGDDFHSGVDTFDVEPNL